MFKFYLHAHPSQQQGHPNKEQGRPRAKSPKRLEPKRLMMKLIMMMIMINNDEDIIKSTNYVINPLCIINTLITYLNN